ncbi:MAG: SPOR domain-containing protein [Kiloniellaceae bacterium]
MTQQKAASLTNSLFAHKGKASPASMLISELEAAGTGSFDPSGRDAAAGAKVRSAGLNGVGGRRKPKPPAELPLLAFVEAQFADEEDAAAPAAAGSKAGEAAAPAVEPAPAASLLERGGESLRRTNGRASSAAAEPSRPVPPKQAAAASEVAAASAFDADIEEILEAETVSGDANVAAIEDAPQDEDSGTAGQAEGEPGGHADAMIVEAAAPAGKDRAADAAIIVEPGADASAAMAAPPGAPADAKSDVQPAAAAAPRKAEAGPALPATMALRQATALHAAAQKPLPAVRHPASAGGHASAARPPRTLPWRSAAVIALGAVLGLGVYLVLAGKPADPIIAAAAPEPLAAPVETMPAAGPAPAEPVEAGAVASLALPDAEAALPEPSFDIIRIEPDGQSIIAGRAEPFSEWILLNNGHPIASVRADVNGEWVVLPDASLVPGANAFSLVPKTERGKVAIPAPGAPASQAPSPGDEPAVPHSGAGGPGGALDAAPDDAVARRAGVALPKPKPPVAALAIPPGAFSVSSAGDYEVQLASVRQTGDAERERGRLAAVFPDLLGRMDLRVLEARLEGAGTFYRVRSGAIADLGVARELCRQLEAKGQGCLVVRRPAGPEAAATEVVEELPDASSAVRQQAERPR